MSGTARVESSSFHTPVLLHEVLAYLLTRADGAYIDGTLGGGGHAEAVLRQLSPTGRLLGLDADADALTAARSRLAPFGPRAEFRQSNFRDMRRVAEEQRMIPVQGILLDLGVSSHQFDDPSRGFSFRMDDRLDMRMDQRQAVDAAAVVNGYEEGALADLFWRYGEERQSRAIARAVVRSRSRKPIATTGELAAIVESVVGDRFRMKVLARVFQAIRIEVNGELDNLRIVIRDGMGMLAPGGRIVIIAYHSLEDRIVKDAFRAAAATTVKSGHVLVPDTPIVPTVRLLTPKPVEAREAEVAANPRARSAKLRAAERV